MICQHLDVATSYNNLANVLRDQGELKQAKEYEQRAHAVILVSLHFVSLLATSDDNEKPRASNRARSKKK